MTNKTFEELANYIPTSEETLIYYDGPQLFTVPSGAANTYIANHVDDDIWMYAEFTPENVKEVLAGKTSFRDGLLNLSETIFIAEWSASPTWENPALHTYVIKPENVPIEWLPTKGATLNAITRIN